MLEERLLVWRFNRGRTDALREIDELYKDELVTLASAMLIDRSAAEDVVHDVFVGFIRSAGTFRLTGTLSGFLATCVANGARNRNKVARRQAAVVPDTRPASAAPEERPDLVAIFGEELQHLGGALAEVPYEQREAVVLHLYSGMGFRAIGQIQNVSINTAQGRYRYGIDRLRTLLDGRILP